MFCSNCGKELGDHDRFCSHCGTAVGAAVPGKKPPNKFKLLVIDDDPTFLDSYLFKFEQEGYSVILARSGQEGLESARKENPSVILLDILMPDMNGLDVLKRLKEDPRTRNIPVVMASIVTEKDAMKQGLILGAVRYITKENIETEEIVGSVRDAVISSGMKFNGSK